MAETPVPNWKEWAMREYWESLEFARLACGVSGDPMYMLESSTGNRVQEIALIAERSISTKTLKFHASPREWLEWAKQKELTVPAELRNAVAKYSPPRALDVTRADKDLTTKERNTLLKLVGGMAIAGHGVDLSKVHAAAARIVGDLEMENIKIAQGTVVKYLTEAAQLLEIGIEKDQ